MLSYTKTIGSPLRGMPAGNFWMSTSGPWMSSRHTEDLREVCLGCMGSVRIAIDADAQQKSREALWVVWGGKPKG